MDVGILLTTKFLCFLYVCFIIVFSIVSLNLEGSIVQHACDIS